MIKIEISIKILIGVKKKPKKYIEWVAGWSSKNCGGNSNIYGNGKNCLIYIYLYIYMDIFIFILIVVLFMFILKYQSDTHEK